MTNTSKKVLIVDDVPINVDFLDCLFQSLGVETVIAYSAAEARELISANKFDLCFVDYHMPDENGGQFIKSCAESDVLDQLGRTFIVTGDTLLNTKKTKLSGLVEGVFFKPVDVEEIESLVKPNGA